MLDDLKVIHEKDAQDALGVAEKQWQQLKQDFSHVDLSAIDFEKIENIVVAGMGGSALAANILQSWPKLMVPFEIWRTYGNPYYTGNKTLFIASSYSGNTEEALDALHEAEGHDCEIVVIASGGALEARALEKNYPYFKIPSGYQPRMAVFYNFAALIALLAPSGLIGAKKLEELHAAADWLGGQVSGWRADVATKDNQAKQIALDIVGKSPVVYASSLFYPAAYKWKINFNENSKNVAWCNQFPEFNHNEFLGWSSHPIDKPYAVINLISSFDHPKIKKRFEVTEKLLSGKMPHPITIEPKGETLLQQMLWIISLGDMVSIYMALLNGLDPSPVVLIEKLKSELAD